MTSTKRRIDRSKEPIPVPGNQPVAPFGQGSRRSPSQHPPDDPASRKSGDKRKKRLQPLHHRDGLLQRTGHQAEGLGQHDPLDLPGAGAALVVGHHRVQRGVHAFDDAAEVAHRHTLAEQRHLARTVDQPAAESYGAAEVDLEDLRSGVRMSLVLVVALFWLAIVGIILFNEVEKVTFPPLNCFSTTLFVGSGEPPQTPRPPLPSRGARRTTAADRDPGCACGACCSTRCRSSAA